MITKTLTKVEEDSMQYLWAKKRFSAKEHLTFYDDPKPLVSVWTEA